MNSHPSRPISRLTHIGYLQQAAKICFFPARFPQVLPVPDIQMTIVLMVDKFRQSFQASLKRFYFWLPDT
jgi:hypothetical protein